MYTLDDTIAAISTPLGQGGIGIVRLSGADALPIARRLFRPAGPDARRGIESHRLHYGHVVRPDSGARVDEVLLSYMRAPRSYTREDVVEINAHGGIVPLREILLLCLSHGARQAREGEFTLRAFLNGRLDLAQAEAVLDVVRARTDAALRVAVDQLGGHLSRETRSVRHALLRVRAYLEAGIDFPDEEFPEEDVAAGLSAAERHVARLLEEAARGMIYRQGVRVTIVGRPNVGKSSLLNRLLRHDRAIVTSVPGTTRDTLEETVDLGGIPLVLVDTAGFTASDDAVERLGVERSRRSIECADLVLLVVDGSVPPDPGDREIADVVGERPAIVVRNKSDLPCADAYEGILPSAPRVSLSALTGEGLGDLEALVQGTVLGGGVAAGDGQAVSSPRHRDALERAHAAVRAAQRALAERLGAEFVAVDVAEAIDCLGEITGETAGDDLLETIFGSFCIGK